MPKETYIKFRCSENFKNMVEYQAKEHQRTISSYIEYLIRKDVDTMKIIFNGCLEDEVIKELKSEKTCYLSSDEEYWLFTDNDVFDRVSKKYRFDEELEERGWDRVTYKNIEEFIRFKYEEDSINCLGIYVDLSNYAEVTAFTLDEMQGELYADGWDKVIDTVLKVDIMMGVKTKIIDNLVEIAKRGYDISEVKSAVEIAQSIVEKKESNQQNSATI